MMIGSDLEYRRIAEQEKRKKADNKQSQSEDPEDQCTAAFPIHSAENVDEQATVGQQPRYLIEIEMKKSNNIDSRQTVYIRD